MDARCPKCEKVAVLSDDIKNVKCPHCGFETSRDHNSALDIKRLTFIEIGKGLAESMLVEMEALPIIRQLPSMKQEASSKIHRI